MKTISTLTAALLIIASFHASANENKENAPINTLAPIVTTPEDVNVKEIENLKNSFIFRLPSIPKLNQEDLDSKEIEQLKIQSPEQVWGSPSDIDTVELQALIQT